MSADEQVRLVPLQRPEVRYQRCAVAFLDVVGFSALMGVDERTTFENWDTLRQTFVLPLIAQHRGRNVKSTGDGILATFARAEDAVAWAAAVQRGARTRGEGLSMRIGLNYGEVIVDAEDDVYGECVNVTARLQQHAQPGAIILTEALCAELPRHDDLFLSGPITLRLKNIAKAVAARHLATDARSLVARETGADSPARLPSVAVLPFDCAGGETLFCSGLVDDIIASLAGVQEVRAIAHSTIRSLGALKNMDAREVGATLGVDYIARGALQRSDGRLRVETELIDAETGEVVISDRGLFAVDEMFTVQDRIVEKIVALIAPEVKRATIRRALRKPPENFTAYEHMLHALDKVSCLDRAGFQGARRHLEAAIEADPGFASPRAWLARWFNMRVGQGWSEDPSADIARALDEAQQAIRLDRRNALALATFGHVTAFARRDYDTAISYLDRAVAAGPNNPIAHTLRSVTLSFLGRGAEARAEAEKALRLSPFDQQLFQFYSFLALAHYTEGDCAEAVRWARRGRAENDNYTNTLKVLVVASAGAGDIEGAREAARILREKDPEFRLATYRTGRAPYREDWRIDRLIEHFRLAGVPD